MESLKNAVGLGENNPAEGAQQGQSTGQGEGGGGFFGGIGNKINSAAGGGKESEKNEDLLDKGMASFRHSVLFKPLCKSY